MIEELRKMEKPLSLTSTSWVMIKGDGSLSLSTSKDKTIKTRNHFLQRKIKLLWTEDQNSSFTLLVITIVPFLQRGKQNVKNCTKNLSSKTPTDVEAPVQWKNWQERSFVAKVDPTLGEGRKRAQNWSLWQNWETLWVLYSSFERLSIWVQ